MVIMNKFKAVVPLNLGMCITKKFTVMICSIFILVFAINVYGVSILLAAQEFDLKKPSQHTIREAARFLEKRWLMGLSGVNVGVTLDPDVERQGLTINQLQIDVEWRLRQAGIPVLSPHDYLMTLGQPMLYIFQSVKAKGNGLIVDQVSISLNQDVKLSRDHNISGSLATWEKISINVIENLEAKDVRKRVMDLIDQFINDYLAANPK